NIGVDRRRARVQRLDVRMILAFAKHSRDDLALLGDPQALVRAQRFDVDLAGHAAKVSIASGGVKGGEYPPLLLQGRGTIERRFNGGGALRRQRLEPSTAFGGPPPLEIEGRISISACACAWCRGRS